MHGCTLDQDLFDMFESTYMVAQQTKTKLPLADGSVCVCVGVSSGFCSHEKCSHVFRSECNVHMYLIMSSECSAMPAVLSIR